MVMDKLVQRLVIHRGNLHPKDDALLGASEYHKGIQRGCLANR